MPTTLIDSKNGVRDLIEEIESSSLQPPLLFMDLEGIYLGRLGSLSILQVLVPPSPIVRLLDVHVLQKSAFETKSSTGTTFKDILESEKYPKVFFDLRNDSDALYSHFDVHLESVIDIQLLEFGTRSMPGRFLKGLAKSISEDSGLGYHKAREWQGGKDAGYKLFDPAKGGSYEVFNQRPLDQAIVDYCASDVLLLPALLQAYTCRLRGRESLAINLQLEAEKRVSLSQSATYNGKGQQMAHGPQAIQNCASYNKKLTFPTSLVMSSELSEHCTLKAEMPKEKVVESAPANTCLPVASTESALDKLATLKI